MQLRVISGAAGKLDLKKKYGPQTTTLTKGPTLLRYATATNPIYFPLPKGLKSFFALCLFATYSCFNWVSLQFFLVELIVD